MIPVSIDRIYPLSDQVKKKIAAGEVIEGPHSVVKELVENSLDAGADNIEIQIFSAGMKRIFVKDNGRGIPAEDISLAIAEHATSKIRDIHDIENIFSFGFRGEALSSLSSVSMLTILSRSAHEETGARLEVKGGDPVITEFAGSQGTTIIAENLFYNVPARKKFLKAERTEMRRIREAVLNAALANPETGFSLDVEGKRQISLPIASSSDERLSQIYGRESAAGLNRETLEDTKVRLTGFLSKPGFMKASRSMQLLYVNRRPVDYKNLGFHLSRAYEAVAGRGEYPAGIIFIEIQPDLVDVNIHPAKREVKLFDQRYMDRLIYQLAVKALDRSHRIEAPSFSSRKETAVPEKSGNAAASFMETTQPRLFSGSASEYHPPADMVSDIELQYQPPSAGALKIFGVLSGTYILAEKEGALYIIDFHAAHERMIFDRLMQREEEPGVQELIFPAVAELSVNEYRTVLDNLDYFSECGFVIEDFSDNTILVRAVPELAGRADPLSIIRQFFDADDTGSDTAADIRKKIASSVACRAARMAGDELPVSDMRAIAEAALNGTMEKRCPHGRPYLHSIDKNDLERMFKRQ